MCAIAFFHQPEILALLVLVAFAAGFLDTIGGGGGLLVIPALLLAQVPPIQAIATNKLQGSFGTLTSAATMVSKRRVSVGSIKNAFAAALAGSVSGALVIQYLPSRLVYILTPLILAVVALYFLFTPGSDGKPKQPVIKKAAYDFGVSPAIGFYDGAFGPGAGSLYTLSGAALAGKNLVSATADAKVLNFASNLAALMTFILSGKILWLAGGVMILGAMAGAYLGSLVVLSNGPKVIRPVIVIMSAAMLVSFVYREFL